MAGERSGHVAVLNGRRVFVWGGYASVENHEVFLPNDELWIYDLESGVWARQGVAGQVPPPMSGSCGCVWAGQMLLFGGCGDDGQTNDLYAVDLREGQFGWRKLTHRSGCRPSPRDKLSCWVDQGRVIYFGGYGQKSWSEVRISESFVVDEGSRSLGVLWGWNNELHTFDLHTLAWSEAPALGHAPAPRAAASAGHRGYVCGGRTREMRRSDLHCLDFVTWAWSEIQVQGPVGRSWHSLTATSDSSLFLFGGLSDDCRPMSDGWVFDLETEGWRRLEHQHAEKPRLWHSACLDRDGDVVVFGGSRDDILLEDKVIPLKISPSDVIRVEVVFSEAFYL